MILLLSFVLTTAAAVSLPADTQDFLLLSFAAYCGDGVAPSFGCYWCKKVNQHFQLVDTFGDAGGSGFGYVGVYAGSQVVVVYRGTDNLAGWISDAEFAQTQLPLAPSGAKVHKGFFEIVSKDAPSILILVKQALALCGPQCPVITTGHSLGASLSTLLAYFLRNNVTNAAVSVINFGSPRLFNPAAAEWLGRNISLIRVTSSRDPVPHLPPENFIEHYQHLVREYWQTDNGPPPTIQACSPTNGEDPACADSVPAWKLDILDHARYMGENALNGIPHGCLYTDS